MLSKGGLLSAPRHHLDPHPTPYQPRSDWPPGQSSAHPYSLPAPCPQGPDCRLWSRGAGPLVTLQPALPHPPGCRPCVLNKQVSNEAQGVPSQPVTPFCWDPPPPPLAGGPLASKPDLQPPRGPEERPPAPRKPVCPALQGRGPLQGGGGWAAGSRCPPVDDVFAQVTLEHETPALDDVEQSLLEGAAVALQPAVEHLGVLTLGHLLVQLLVGIDLESGATAQSGGRGRRRHSTRAAPTPLRGTASRPGSPGFSAAQWPVPSSGNPSERDAIGQGQHGLCRTGQKPTGECGQGRLGAPTLGPLCAALHSRGSHAPPAAPTPCGGIGPGARLPWGRVTAAHGRLPVTARVGNRWRFA